MEDPLRELHERLEQVEASLARLANQQTASICAALDGAYIHLNDRSGRTSVTLGCHPDGGFLDILHTESGRLAVTVTATPEGGNIEVTDTNGNCRFDAIGSNANR